MNIAVVNISSVAQSCPTLCDPMDCSMPGVPVHHLLLKLAQTHVHRVGDAIDRGGDGWMLVNREAQISFQLQFFWIYIQSRIARSYDSSIFNFEEPPYCSPGQLHNFTFLPIVYEGSNLSTYSPKLVFFSFFPFFF